MTEYGNHFAVSRLLAKRTELARIVAVLQKELDQYRADLAHIDGALRVLRADADPSAVQPGRRYKKTQYFGHNELSRLCMDTLRLAAEPLTAEGVTLRIMVAKSLDARDASLRAATDVVSRTAAIVENSKPKLSCRTNATRSWAERRSSTAWRATPTVSAIATSSAWSRAVSAIPIPA